MTQRAGQITSITTMMDNLKILLVDDDKIMLFLHEMFLKKSGILHDTVLCYNGSEALEYLDSSPVNDTHYLVLLDINMPVMNGWEFLDAISDREYLDRVHVIMVSSGIEDGEMKRALSYKQVIDYQQKPLNFDSCATIVQNNALRSFFEAPTAE